MTVPLNVVRIILAVLWTTIVGTPLMLIIYSSYAYGLLRARCGRREVLDRILEMNAQVAGWVARVWTAGVLALAGVRLRVRELVPVDWSRAHVVCANHASIFDILALIRVVPPPFRFVAKRELLGWPFIGWALHPAGQIVVDRSDRSRALRAIAEAAVRKIRGQVIFFVEGTRSRSGSLLPFKKGAFHFATDNLLPILPTAIRGSYAALAKLPWWRLRPGRQIEVVFCASIEPETFLPSETVNSLLSSTRDSITAALSVGDA